MAHSCSKCCGACYCGGDIDDMFMDGTDEECGGCGGCDDEDVDDEFDCLDCGTCSGCVQRAIDYDEEMRRSSS